MVSLEDLLHDSYDHLFDFQIGQSRVCPFGAVNKDLEDTKTPIGVMDSDTLRLLETGLLYETMNHTRTITGSSVLLRSIRQPLLSLKLIEEKQRSLKEIERDTELREDLERYVTSVSENEWEAYSLFFNRWDSNNRRSSDSSDYTQYEVYKRGARFLKDMVEKAKEMPDADSEYLSVLVNDIREIDGTFAYDLVKGPVFKTLDGIKPGTAVKLHTPKVKFTLRKLKPTYLGVLYGLPALHLWHTLNTAGPEMVKFLVIFPYLAPGMLFFGLATTLLPEWFDESVFIKPLSKTYKDDSGIRKGLEAFGKIDELLSFYEYGKSIGPMGCLPTVTNPDEHYFIAEDLRNPILVGKIADYVPNSIALDSERLTTITGPNSGGKTRLCQAIAHAQIQGQIGSYTTAKQAEMGIADKIFYNSIEFEPSEQWGKFEVEIDKIKEKFFNTSPKNLVILDDSLAGTTTHKEVIDQLYGILSDFETIRNTTIFATHNYEIAEVFYKENTGQHLQVEFDAVDDAPTYRVVPGISTYSHAAKVVERRGFSPKDRERYLRSKGYLK